MLGGAHEVRLRFLLNVAFAEYLLWISDHVRPCFFGDNFFRFGPIGPKFSHLTFQPKRRFLSIWSVNKKSIIKVLVITS